MTSLGRAKKREGLSKPWRSALLALLGKVDMVETEEREGEEEVVVEVWFALPRAANQSPTSAFTASRIQCG